MLIASAVQQEVTAGDRGTLAGRLNADYGSFKPEVILAEECARVLQTSKKVRFSSVTLRAEPVPLPGLDEILQGDTQHFTSVLTRRGELYQKTMAWTKTVAPHEGVGSPSGAQPQISIEVCMAGLDLVNSKKLDVYAVSAS